MASVLCWGVSHVTSNDHFLRSALALNSRKNEAHALLFDEKKAPLGVPSMACAVRALKERLHQQVLTRIVAAKDHVVDFTDVHEFDAARVGD